MIHYEDAAEAVIACLAAPGVVRGQVFLVADGVPVSRQDIAAAAAFHPRYRDSSEAVRFTGGQGTDGKKYNCQKIRSKLGRLITLYKLGLSINLKSSLRGK